MREMLHRLILPGRPAYWPISTPEQGADGPADRPLCQSGGMSFFESIPERTPPPPEPPRRRPAWQRPDAVLPGSVPAELVLIRTEQVAVAVGSVRAYPNGFEFTVHVRWRGAGDTDWPYHGGPFERHGNRRGGPASEDALRLGVLYADGRRAATTGGSPWRDPDAEPGRLVLEQGGGGGNDRSWDSDFWVYPLPPPGPVTLLASWLEQGVTETRAELDGAAIRDAAGRAVTLWPEEPEEPEAGYGSAARSATITAASSGHQGASTGPDRPGPRRAEPAKSNRQHFLRPEGMPPVNGYSHAVAFTGRMVAVSGQVPADEQGRLVGPGDAVAQVRQVFRNLAAALAAAGARMDKVVKLTVYQTDLADLEAFRQVRDEYVSPDNPPASSLVQVSRLVNPDFRVEIEALAAI